MARPASILRVTGVNNSTTPDGVAKLLAALEGVEEQQRRARFVCVIAITDPRREETILIRGECPGRIASRDHDDGQGFGYDSVFMPEGYELTFGQLRPELKDGLSHRARAAQKSLAHPARNMQPHALDWHNCTGRI